MPIYDTADNLIQSASFSLRPSEVATGSFKVDCVTGWQVSGVAVADIAVELKHSADVGYTNIETTPISLTTWNGTTQTFNFRMTRSTGGTGEARAFAFTVSRA